MFGKILVIAPHLDDETIGVGGTIKKLIELRFNIQILVVGGHLPPLYSKKNYEITKKESIKAIKTLGPKKTYYLDIPATEYHKDYYQIINKKISEVVNTFKPRTVFIPFPDRHIDHRTIFDCAMVNTRPNKKYYPKFILAYETLSETHWNAPYIEPNFVPNFFIDIDKSIKYKIKALKCYKSQILGNKSRSLDAIMALAKFRGSQNGCNYAEAFKLIRAIV
jgi:LmbE family N-acetylglucosaminyl deacetylase